MKKIYTGLAIFFLSAIISFDKTSAEPVKSIESEFISSLPEVKKQRMKNNINLLYLEDDLPVTVIYASVSFGKMYETAADAGLADVLSKTLSIAGTSSYPGNSMYQKLESVGGEINISAGWETLGIEIKVLTKYSNLAFNILGDILKNPVFEEAGVAAAKKLVIERVKRDKDKPDETGVLKLREIIFGGSGYGAVPDEKSIGAINPVALKTVWDRYAAGENITVAVSSSGSEKEILALAEKEFSDITKGERGFYSVDRERIKSDLKSHSGNIYLIPADLEQATIYTGTLAPEINYDGNYALYMMNYILGGGSFSSRLMNDIRVKRGLAYSVYSLVRNRRNTGVFISFVQTRNESAAEVLSLLYNNIKLITEEPVTKEELQWAKESVKNSYVFRFNTVNDLLGNFLEMEYNDLDAGYYKNYLDNINKVSADDIVEEGKKMFSQGLVTVVVGNRKLEKELSRYGKVIICE